MIILEEKLYTSEETATILGISPRTLYRYLKKGDIEAETKTRSGTFRFTRFQIYKYLYPDNFESILNKLKEKEGVISSSYVYINDNEIDNYKPLKKPVDVSSLPDENENLEEITSQKTEELPEEKSEIDLIKDLKNEVPLIEPSPVTSPSPSISNAPVPPLVQNVQQPPAQNFQPVNVPIEPRIDISTPQSDDVQKLKEERATRNLDSELSDLQKTIDVPFSSKVITEPVVYSNNLIEEKWFFYVNKSKDILDLARDIANISNESGRKYASTMRGGLSLHHDIEAFNLIHVYVDFADLDSWVKELALNTCSEAEANIVLIPTKDDQVFSKSYKLRGLYVVADERLIQDLMSHNEKELAKSLL